MYHSELKETCFFPVQEGSVSLLRFSTDELTLAVVCGGGHVGFWELNLQEQGVSKVMPLVHSDPARQVISHIGSLK